MKKSAIALNIFVSIVLLYLLLPTFVILPISFSEKSYLEFPPSIWSTVWYQRLFSDLNYALAFGNSIRIGIPAAVLSTVLGSCAALAVARGSFRGKKIFQSISIGPLMLPQIVYAIGAYPVMAKLNLLSTYAAVVIGHTVICIPVVFITVTASLRSYREPLELAAMTLGANYWQTFWHVTFPMIRGGVIAGFLIAFTLSFDDLIIALFLASPTTRTIPLLLWQSMRYELTPLATAAASIILISTCLVLIVSMFLQRQK
jgi:ABC-type spermidine/putrescine transport system permease subunit II